MTRVTDTDTQPAVTYEALGGRVAVARLNRPTARNAINGEVTRTIDRIVNETEADPSIGAVVLASSTPGIFCAGGDLVEIAAGRYAELTTPKGGFSGLVEARRTKPWIAAVSGWAAGGGFELALACDMIVASEGSRFGLPEVKRGLIAAAGGAFELPRRIPRNIAAEVLATGEPLDGNRAYALGLVNRLVSEEAITETAIALAQQIAANAPLAVAASLELLDETFDQTVSDLLGRSRALAMRVFESADAREGVAVDCR